MRFMLMIAALALVLQGGAPPVAPPVEKGTQPVEKDKNRGGPGATKEAQKLPQEQRRERTFLLHLPPDLHVAAGQHREVTIDLDSGINFHQRVQIYFGAPEGVRVLPAHAQIEPGDKQTTITLVADRDLTAGDTTLHVVGEPETGEAILMKVPVHVDRPK